MGLFSMITRVSWCRLRANVTAKRTKIMKIRAFSTERDVQLPEGISSHVSRLMEQYRVLVERVNTGSEEEDHRSIYRSISKLEPVANLVQMLEGKTNELAELKQLSVEDGDMKSLALEEAEKCQQDINTIKASLIEAIIPRDEADEHSAILEVRAGAGGVEASIFASEIFQMYQRFSGYRQWAFEQLSVDQNDAGGYKHATASLSGCGVFGMLKHEVGVHRVQRVPVTEGLGRVHTSTMSVVILPQPTQIEVEINPNDIRIDTMRASGAGGQHVNTTDSAVRLTHLPTGIVISIQDEKSQHKNRAKAMKILEARLYELQRQSAMKERSEQRKLQMGTQGRSEKIRTYNFPQDRVTDHRLGNTVYGVEEFLSGGDMLDEVIGQLRSKEEAELLSNLSSQ